MDTPVVISLTEYETKWLAPETIPAPLSHLIWEKYAKQLTLTPPSYVTKSLWGLRSEGWVGYIPLTSELALSLAPRVPLGNLFRMLEYAYRLESFNFLDGLSDFKSLEEFYERLAMVLARRVLDRSRKGFYREYIGHQDELPYVSGRIDIAHSLRKPGITNLRCNFELNTADIEDNQILAWTLHRVLQSGIGREQVKITLRQAYRALQGFVVEKPFNAKSCVGRLYNRLNDDYRPIHALCRFFLEHTGPSHQLGSRTMLPFLVNMPRLFELFVAEWIRNHLPGEYHLSSQERVSIGENNELSFNIDLVIVELATGHAKYVMDTKYKNLPATANDVAQIVAYSTAKACKNAFLIYPQKVPKKLDGTVGNIRVRSVDFELDGDLEAHGNALLRDIFR